MNECKCSMAIKVLGDGCEVCNPALALEYAKETIAMQSDDIKSLRFALERLLKATELYFPKNVGEMQQEDARKALSITEA